MKQELKIWVVCFALSAVINVIGFGIVCKYTNPLINSAAKVYSEFIERRLNHENR